MYGFTVLGLLPEPSPSHSGNRADRGRSVTAHLPRARAAPVAPRHPPPAAAPPGAPSPAQHTHKHSDMGRVRTCFGVCVWGWRVGAGEAPGRSVPRSLPGTPRSPRQHKQPPTSCPAPARLMLLPPAVHHRPTPWAHPVHGGPHPCLLSCAPSCCPYPPHPDRTHPTRHPAQPVCPYAPHPIRPAPRPYLHVHIAFPKGPHTPPDPTLRPTPRPAHLHVRVPFAQQPHYRLRQPCPYGCGRQPRGAASRALLVGHVPTPACGGALQGSHRAARTASTGLTSVSDSAVNPHAARTRRSACMAITLRCTLPRP